MSVQYICDGAIIQCTYGNTMPALRVLPDRTVTLTKGNYGNISDHESLVNIPSFGLCRSLKYPLTKAATDANHGRLTPMRCRPSTMQLWEGGNEAYLIRNYPALQSNSYCKCIYGGVITFVNNGQQPEHFELGREEGMQRETPYNQVSEGNERGVDVIDFIPVVGSIRDIGEGIATGSVVLVLFGIGGLALDVCTGGAGSIVKGAAKGALKTGIKSLGKSATREIAEESVENVVKKEGKYTADLLGETFKQKVAENVVKKEGKYTADLLTSLKHKVAENFGEEALKNPGKNNPFRIISESAETGAKNVPKSPKIEIQTLLKDISDRVKGELEKLKQQIDVSKIKEFFDSVKPESYEEVLKKETKRYENLKDFLGR